MISREKIDDLKRKPLSNDEVLKLIDGKANFLLYPQLSEYDNIDEALGNHGACILLYMTKSNYGHFACVFKSAANKIEHFDSYGIKIDDEIKFIPKAFRKVSNQNYPHLTHLLLKSNYEIEYNEHKLQEKGANIATCGRHVAYRLYNRDMPLNEYAELVTSFGKEGFNADDVVTIACEI